MRWLAYLRFWPMRLLWFTLRTRRVRVRLVTARRRLAAHQSAVGRDREALSTLERALRSTRAAPRIDEPMVVGPVLAAIAVSQHMIGETERARSAAEQALALIEPELDVPAGSVESAGLLAPAPATDPVVVWALLDVAFVLDATGAPEWAASVADTAQQVVDRHPNTRPAVRRPVRSIARRVAWRRVEAFAALVRARRAARLHRYREADNAYRAAIAMYADRVRPWNIWIYRPLRARAVAELAHTLGWGLSRPVEAARLLEGVVGEGGATLPTLRLMGWLRPHRYLRSYLNACANLAHWAGSTGRHRAGVAYAKTAVAGYRRILAGRGRVPGPVTDDRRCLAAALTSLAYRLNDLNHPAVGLAAVREALALRRDLADDSLADRRLLLETLLIRAGWNGDGDAHAARTGVAADLVEVALQIAERTGDPTDHLTAGRLYHLLGARCAEDDPDRAAACFASAAELADAVGRGAAR